MIECNPKVFISNTDEETSGVFLYPKDNDNKYVFIQINNAFILYASIIIQNKCPYLSIHKLFFNMLEEQNKYINSIILYKNNRDLTYAKINIIHEFKPTEIIIHAVDAIIYALINSIPIYIDESLEEDLQETQK